jgi:hypothetical protein
VALFPNGAAAWLAECAGGFTEYWKQYVTESTPGRTPAEVLLAAMDPSTAEWRSLADWEAAERENPDVSWDALVPTMRYVEPPYAPAELLESLSSVWMLVDLPTGWDAIEGTMCPFLPDLGWAACVEVDSAASLRFLPALTPHFAAGQPLEIWVLPPDYPDSEATRLLTVEAGVLDEAVTAGDWLRLRGAFDPSGWEDVSLALADRRDVLRVDTLTEREAQAAIEAADLDPNRPVDTP